jgi:hypothetical protein
VEVHVAGGKVFQAVPQESPEYEMKAYALGFSSSWEMCKWHDLTHAWLADRLGLPASPALLAASGVQTDHEITDAEEHVVMALHRFINLLQNAGTKTTLSP